MGPGTRLRGSVKGEITALLPFVLTDDAVLGKPTTNEENVAYG